MKNIFACTKIIIFPCLRLHVVRLSHLISHTKPLKKYLKAFCMYFIFYFKQCSYQPMLNSRFLLKCTGYKTLLHQLPDMLSICEKDNISASVQLMSNFTKHFHIKVQFCFEISMKLQHISNILKKYKEIEF